MTSPSALVEIRVASRRIEVLRNKERVEGTAGDLSFATGDVIDAIDRAGDLIVGRFADPATYLNAERLAGERIYSLLARSTAFIKPAQVIDQVVRDTDRPVRVAMELTDVQLDKIPWELAVGEAIDDVRRPWGVHPKVWLGRKPSPGEAPPPRFEHGTKGGPVHAVVVPGGPDVEHTCQQIVEALRGIPVDERKLRVSRVDEVWAAERHEPPPAISLYHFVGHGSDAIMGSTDHTFELDSAKVPARELKQKIDQLGRGQSAALYVIMACHSSHCGRTAANEAGTAYEVVVSSGAPVVVATQGVVNAAEASAMSTLLYAFLSRGQAVDEAVANVRRLGRRIQVALNEDRVALRADCACVYTWPQLAVAYRHESSLDALSGFTVRQAPLGRYEKDETTRLRTMFERLHVRSPATPRRTDGAFDGEAVERLKVCRRVFPRMGRLVAPYVDRSLDPTLSTPCNRWHALESLKLALAAAVAHLGDDVTLEEMTTW